LAPTCGHEMPVWDKVCPECGAKQPDLVSAKMNALTANQEAAERDLADFDFAAAAEIADSLSQITDIRFGEFQEWGRAFGDRVATEKVAADELVAARVSEARTHQAAYDYAAAIHALDSLPQQQRAGDVGTLLKELRSQAKESKQLLETIKDRIAARDLDGLLELATRALVLRGDRADLRKIVAQLEEREEKLRDQRSKAFASAQRLFFESGDAKAAMEKIASLNSGLTPSQTQFKKLVNGAALREDELVHLLASAKADGTITADEVVSLANQTVRCLQLNPHHRKITALLQQLVDRIEKRPTDYGTRIEQLRPVAAFLRGTSGVPGNFLRLLDRHERSQEAARQMASWGKKKATRTADFFDKSDNQALRDKIKADMRSRAPTDRVSCPVCNAQCRADRLVQHYDRQHSDKW
jgi:hypothetical protein